MTGPRKLPDEAREALGWKVTLQRPPVDYQAIVVYGNPVDGLHFIGPFVTANDANDYADRYLDGSEYWTTELVAPSEDES